MFFFVNQKKWDLGLRKSFDFQTKKKQKKIDPFWE